MIGKLFVLFDDACGFCVRCAQWMVLQPKLVAIEAIAMSSNQAAHRFPGLRKLEKAELTVIDDQGGVYRGPKAWLMCLWALSDWRPWSYRLARPSVMPFARHAFELVSNNRHRINGWLALKADRDLVAAIQAGADEPRCDSPGCATAH